MMYSMLILFFLAEDLPFLSRAQGLRTTIFGGIGLK